MRFESLFPPDVKCVGIIAPSCPAMDPERVDKGISLLEEAGYKVKVMPHARMDEGKGSYWCIPKELRLADLEQAWFDPEIDVIFCIRGGRGSLELLEHIDYEKYRRRCQTLVGFSDITCLQQAMLKKRCGRMLSGPSLTSILRQNDETLEWFKKCTAGAPLPPVQLKVLTPGSCSGKAAGGHLFLVADTFEKGYALSAAGRIVFLEDPRKNLEKSAEKLDMLLEKGYFTDCAGVVFGEFLGPASDDEKEAVMRDVASRIDVPVFCRYPYGHGDYNFMIDFERIKHISAEGVMEQ